MNLTLRNPSNKEFEQICLHIREYELDNRDLQQQQFTVAIRENKLVGFGRLRTHPDCMELCSLGVVTDYRKQGIGKAIVQELIKKAIHSIYLVCIIPDFFKPFGFRETEKYPASILDKKKYCNSELVVPERYVVMKR